MELEFKVFYFMTFTYPPFLKMMSGLFYYFKKVRAM